MSKLENPWGKIKFIDNIFEFSFNDNISIKIEKKQNEVVLQTKEFEQTTINRYITGEGITFFLEPGLPDQPIVFKPVQNISILPGKRFDVFVEVPFNVRLLCGTEKKQRLLKEIITHKMSKSFFGDPEFGEFAYYLKSELNCNIENYLNKEKSIYCPLLIINNSTETLEFEKMILRVPYLSVYYSSKYLIANPVVISFRGQDQISQISYKKSPPNVKESLSLITRPRLAEDKNILKKSFYLIKNLYTE